MTKPRAALVKAGAETTIVSVKSGQIFGIDHEKKEDTFGVDLTLEDARPEEFIALMIAGGE